MAGVYTIFYNFVGLGRDGTFARCLLFCTRVCMENGCENYGEIEVQRSGTRISGSQELTATEINNSQECEMAWTA